MSAININHDTQTAFMKAMGDAGLESHHRLTIEADGQLKRLRVKGDKPGSKNGWYVLFNDGLAAGSFGNWKTGLTASWCARNKNEMSKAERSNMKLQQQKAITAYKKKRLHEQHCTAIKCGQLWNDAKQLVDVNHPYLVDKQIRAYGIRQLGNNLLIPIQNPQNQLVSHQFIKPDGSKTFISGGRVKGCFMIIGELKGTVFLCEGYATGATIHQVTGKSVLVAFNAGNLTPVIAGLNAQGLGHLNIIVVADNDYLNTVNTGLIKGQECASTYKLPLIYPTFTNEQAGSDFNDLATLLGLTTVGEYLLAAVGDIR